MEYAQICVVAGKVLHGHLWYTFQRNGKITATSFVSSHLQDLNCYRRTGHFTQKILGLFNTLQTTGNSHWLFPFLPQIIGEYRACQSLFWITPPPPPQCLSFWVLRQGTCMLRNLMFTMCVLCWVRWIVRVHSGEKGKVQYLYIAQWFGKKTCYWRVLLCLNEYFLAERLTEQTMVSVWEVLSRRTTGSKKICVLRLEWDEHVGDSYQNCRSSAECEFICELEAVLNDYQAKIAHTRTRGVFSA